MVSVTRRSGRGPEHREAVAQALQDAVERLLDEGHGYTMLGVQQIADEAGIGRSTFYLHFRDKTALLLVIAEAATDGLFTAAEAWTEAGFADQDALERTLTEIVGYQRAHANVLSAVMEVAAYEPEVASFWRERVGAFVTGLAGRIREGQAGATINPALDPDVTAAWITWGVERLIMQHGAVAADEQDSRMVSGLATAIWSTLGRESA